ncbi:hypothetical protein Bca52824_053725 [Brassica carinata]|uniref:Uncharacterized protein n=1 Tax=Brassica carinata TaxID=52824 RepID=A0A8X7R8J9_BRACI|nr:hypothetical protein Bca52824_053725 [Brassica carinata]
MVELCGLFPIAPSQLTLRSWGLIHPIQVLSDLSAVEITGSMVATAFRTREIGVRFSSFRVVTTSSFDFPFVGVSSEDPAESTAFPENLLNLATNLRDPAFLLHPDIIQMTSLASTDDHLYVPEQSMDALIAARVHFDSFSLDSSISVERTPSQLCPDEPPSHSPPDRDENPSSSK